MYIPAHTNPVIQLIHTRGVCVITLGLIHVPLPAWCGLPLRSVYTYLPVSCMNIHTYQYTFPQIRLKVTVAVKFTHLIDALSLSLQTWIRIERGMWILEVHINQGC